MRRAWIEVVSIIATFIEKIVMVGIKPTLRMDHNNPFAFSAATSSAASLTITPLLRFGGGA